MKNKLHKLSLYAYKLGLIPALSINVKMFFGKKGEIISLKVPGVRFPVFIRAKTSDDYTFQQIFVNGEYEFKYEGTPHHIIDAGSNIGLAAVYFANSFPGAKIICLEPEQSNFDLLLLNTKQYDNIIPLKKGLWSKASFLKVEMEGRDNWGFVVKECKSDEAGAIEATSVPDIMQEYNIPKIDIAKIDIEGSEIEVLTAADALSWMQQCRMLVIELHDRMKPGTSEALFKQMLQLSPFRVEISGENLICEPRIEA